MKNPIISKAGINDCWNQIGVVGDRSCVELETFIHCRNCPVYSAAGRSLLEREAPVGYVNEWTNLLFGDRQEKSHTRQSKSPHSVAIFRLGAEWLALPAALLKEVTPPSVIHTLPHRSNQILMGLVNIRGEIQLCISLGALLKLQTTPSNQNLSHVIYQRMVLVEKDGSCWVFPVDEIEGIHRIHPDDLRNVPATVSKVPDSYTKGMLSWRDKSVSYLDEELVFYTLNRRVL